jgi:hypothetical protein
MKLKSRYYRQQKNRRIIRGSKTFYRIILDNGFLRCNSMMQGYRYSMQRPNFRKLCQLSFYRTHHAAKLKLVISATLYLQNLPYVVRFHDRLKVGRGAHSSKRADWRRVNKQVYSKIPAFVSIKKGVLKHPYL